MPKTITIKGKSSDLENIESIKTQEVDITEITEDTTIDLVPILPDKIQISDNSSSLVLIVKIQALSSKTFTFDEGDVDLTGLEDDLKGQVKAGKIEIVVKGTEEAMAAIKKVTCAFLLIWETWERDASGRFDRHMWKDVHVHGHQSAKIRVTIE